MCGPTMEVDRCFLLFFVYLLFDLANLANLFVLATPDSFATHEL